MSIEHLMAQVNAKVNEDARRAGIMKLGGLRTAMSLLPPDTEVAFDSGGHPGRLDSYRGYYERLAYDTQQQAKSAAAVLEDLDAADGEMFQGYKGGDYWMDAGTFLHAAAYGCTGDAIVGVRLDGNRAIIETAEEEW